MEEEIAPIVDSKEIDYPLFRNGMISLFNRVRCGFEVVPELDHPLKNYVASESLAVGYDYWKDDTKNFFVEFPEAHKLTGESLESIRAMTIAEYMELKEDIVRKHYELKKQYPDTLERLLLEFREYAQLQAEGLKYAGVIRERKSKG